MPYPEEMVAPMRAEVVDLGVQELRTAAEVKEAMANSTGTALYFINSVCGCAAGSARPGLKIALGNDNKPAKIGTVFAGQDREATDAARGAASQFPPSSPSVVLFKNGEPVFYMPRHQIEGRDAPSVAFELVGAFDEFCS
ncbi:MAG: BrxA/BrxB family bacilliredoxin [Planctomycetota bacterium]|nr:BrxA/BrxB family bacilliredoxin [Planctomycetota bacterium]